MVTIGGLSKLQCTKKHKRKTLGIHKSDKLNKQTKLKISKRNKNKKKIGKRQDLGTIYKKHSFKIKIFNKNIRIIFDSPFPFQTSNLIGCNTKSINKL